jgi:hypothetical protein
MADKDLVNEYVKELEQDKEFFDSAIQFILVLRKEIANEVVNTAPPYESSREKIACVEYLHKLLRKEVMLRLNDFDIKEDIIESVIYKLYEAGEPVIPDNMVMK